MSVPARLTELVLSLNAVGPWGGTVPKSSWRNITHLCNCLLLPVVNLGPKYKIKMSKIIANYNRFCLLLIYPSFHNSTLYEKQKIFREMSPGFVSTQRKSMGSNVVGLPTFFQKYFICSAEERKSYRFGIFGVNYPFKRLSILVNHAKITIQKPDYKSHVVSMPFMRDIIIMYMTTL